MQGYKLAVGVIARNEMQRYADPHGRCLQLSRSTRIMVSSSFQSTHGGDQEHHSYRQILDGQ